VGPGWKIQEVSRVGAQGVTSKSKLLAREMPRVCSRGLRVDSGESLGRTGVRAGQRVDRRGSYASSGPGWEIQEVSRVGAQGVTSKSKLLALEMPDLRTGGLLVDSGSAPRRKGARAEQRVDRSGSYASAGPEWEMQEVSRVGAQGATSKSKLLAREMPRVCSRGLRADSEATKSLKVASAQSGPKSMRRSSPRDLYVRYRR